VPAVGCQPVIIVFGFPETKHLTPNTWFSCL
jgi:hypothetical protein